MLISVLNVVLLTGTFLYMFWNAQFARTRRVALIPLSCAGMEILFAGLLTASLHPVLTLVRLAMIGIILLSCVGAMRKDTAMAHRRAHRAVARQTVKVAATPVTCRQGSAVRCA